MSHIPNAPASEVEKQEHIQNALFNVAIMPSFRAAVPSRRHLR